MTARKIVIATLGAALIAGAAIPAFAAPDQPRPHHLGKGPHGGPGGPGGPGRAIMQDVFFIRLLKEADSNHDGKISKDEFNAWENTLFTAIDGNKDGAITRGEILDYRIAKMEEFRKNNPPPEQAGKGPDAKGPDAKPGERRPGDHGPGHHPREARWHKGPHGPDGGPMGGMMGNRMFRMIDANHDGKISKEEASAAADKLFARMDTNKDETISIDDLPDRPL
jgi:Ca2+-binding EF-hand superfamily protein